MNEQMKAVFDESVIGVLATINEDGSPWASPLHLVLGDGYIHWFSTEDKVHSLNVARDSRVSIAHFSRDTSGGPKGVYINGEAELLDEEGRKKTYELFQRRLGNVPSAFENASAYRVPVGDYSEQKSTGNCWYFYS